MVPPNSLCLPESPPLSLLAGTEQCLPTLRPNFDTHVFEAVEPILWLLVDEVGLRRGGRMTQHVGQIISYATAAARAVLDRISQRRLNRLAVALFIAEWSPVWDGCERYPATDAFWVYDDRELDAVNEFALTSCWEDIKDCSLRSTIQNRLYRAALRRLNLADALVCVVQGLADGYWEDVFRVLGGDEDHARRRALEALKNLSRMVMDVANEVLVRHGRKPPVRYTVGK